MSLQNLELTPSVIAELYRDFLVDAGGSAKPSPAVLMRPAAPAKEPVVAPAPAVEPAVKFLGGNKKRIAFIVSCATDVFLPDAHLDWLGKMLEACKLNLGDVAIVNVARAPLTIADIKNALHPNTVILLGTDPQSIQLPMNFPVFNPQPYDGMTFLNTPAPDQLNQPTSDAKLLKSKLWVCLQKLFNL